ncbi:MAG: hypothetical protein KAG37_07805 [Flavobacteriales bacterium]|nr:hypothetical protein [Flavobacteriales bacterium]
MQSVESKIKTRILHKRKGTVMFPDDFLDLGSSVSIRKALQILVSKNYIKRISQGIYVRPKISEFVGEILPTAEDVARAIAKRDKIRIMPTGALALNALRLSTQVPMNVVYLTDGSPRKIIIGKRSILFKKTCPKNLSTIGPISSIVILALKEIGKDNAYDSEIKIILEHLKKEDPYNIEHDIVLAPEWIRKIMRKAHNNEE